MNTVCVCNINTHTYTRDEIVDTIVALSPSLNEEEK